MHALKKYLSCNIVLQVWGNCFRISAVIKTKPADFLSLRLSEISSITSSTSCADDLQIYLSGPVTAIENLCKLMNIDVLAIH